MTCDICDFIGPEEDTLQAAARELHRAGHRLVEALVGPLCDWQVRVLDQVTSGKVKRKALLYRVGRRW